MVWGVLSRVIEFMCKNYGQIKFMVSYVDDSTLVTTRSRVKGELTTLLKIIRMLCGDDGVAEEKTVWGERSLVVQGFLHDFDEDGRSMMMSQRNLEKSIYQVMLIPASWKLTRKNIESIASRLLRLAMSHRC